MRADDQPDAATMPSQHSIYGLRFNEFGSGSDVKDMKAEFAKGDGAWLRFRTNDLFLAPLLMGPSFMCISSRNRGAWFSSSFDLG